MSKKRIIWLSVAAVLSIAAILDAIRYLKPDAENKQKVQSQNTFPVSSAKEMILVYNAYGGIYPGIKDVIHKEFFPSSYPCNLCYQTFGTFGMKEEWKHFLDSLSYKRKELHKDEFKRNYQPRDLPLPAILLSDGKRVELLISAQQISKQKSLQHIKEIVSFNLKH